MTRSDPPGGESGLPPGMAADLAKQNLVCFCHSIPVCEIVEAIRKGATTVAEIQAETLASTGCGGCECDILDLLEKYAGRRS